MNEWEFGEEWKSWRLKCGNIDENMSFDGCCDSGFLLGAEWFREFVFEKVNWWIGDWMDLLYGDLMDLSYGDLTDLSYGDWTDLSY